MEYLEKDGAVVLKGQNNFDPEQIFECGQAFRWTREEDGTYTFIAHGRLVNVSQIGEDLVFKNASIEDFENIWIEYFDLKTDYTKIQAEFLGDEVLQKAIEYGNGIRILNQDPFETTISFIISANNRIPQIKKSIDLICRTYGEKIGSMYGREYYSFPSPEVLSQVDVKELREICRVGFRDERIVKTAQIISSGDIDLEGLMDKPREEIRETLISLPGVGPKVADCICLFAFKKKDSFPVDVWIKRVMENLYFKEEVNKNKVGQLGREKFGKYAGVAQQYLFYYGRENDIGKM